MSLTCPRCGADDCEPSYDRRVAYCFRCDATFPTGQVQTSLRRFRD